MDPKEQREALLKSVDTKVDEYFIEETPSNEEPVEKSAKDNRQGSGSSKTSADEGEKAPKPKEEKDGDNGRPKDPSNMNKRDQYGDAGANYDKDYTAPAKKQAHETTVAKSEPITVSPEDFELLQKAKEAQKEEILQKAKDEQATLLKSVVAEALQPVQEELAGVKEENAKLNVLVKSMKSKPQARKSISSVAAIEKSFGSNEPTDAPEQFQKSEIEGAIDELQKSGQISEDAYIEYDMTGTFSDPADRAKVERKLQGGK